MMIISAGLKALCPASGQCQWSVYDVNAGSLYVLCIHRHTQRQVVTGLPLRDQCSSR